MKITDMLTSMISKPSIQDIPGIADLYRVAAVNEGGLARTHDEITDEYILNNFHSAQNRGVCFIAKTGTSIIGEMHAYRAIPKVFSHVLSDLTIVIHPDHQGLGIGRALFASFLHEIETNCPDILRVELIARESNKHAIHLYECLGFKQEGRLEGRIRSTGGGFEADIPMAWHRTAT